MRNTPLPFMSPVNLTDSEQLTKDLAKGFQDKKRQELTETFKSARTKKQERKDQFKKDKKAEREDIRTTKKALKNIRYQDAPDKDEAKREFKDRKKAERKSLQNVRIQERKKRAEDKKQEWAEKKFLKGKYDSVDEAKKRFETLKDITVKQGAEYSKIMGDSIVGSNDPGTDASEAVAEENSIPITDASMDVSYTKGFGSGIYNS